MEGGGNTLGTNGCVLRLDQAPGFGTGPPQGVPVCAVTTCEGQVPDGLELVLQLHSVHGPRDGPAVHQRGHLAI